MNLAVALAAVLTLGAGGDGGVATPELLDPFAGAPRTESTAEANQGVLRLLVDAHLVHRQLHFSSPDATSSYATRLPTPALGLQASYRPGWADRRVGAALAAELGREAWSQSGDARYRSANGELRAGVIVALGSRPRMALLQVAVGTQWWTLEPLGAASTQPRPIPGVTYGFVRVGADLRSDLSSRLLLCLGFHYRHVTAAGPINWRDWYPGGSVYGLDATFGLGYRFDRRFEASLQSGARYYRHDLSEARPTRHVPANGAEDLFLAVGVSLTARFGGVGDE